MPKFGTLFEWGSKSKENKLASDKLLEDASKDMLALGNDCAKFKELYANAGPGYKTPIPRKPLEGISTIIQSMKQAISSGEPISTELKNAFDNAIQPWKDAASIEANTYDDVNYPGSRSDVRELNLSVKLQNFCDKIDSVVEKHNNSIEKKAEKSSKHKP